MYKKNRKGFTDRVHNEVCLLERLVTTEQELKEHSNQQGSLYIVERKQNIRKSLCNITDHSFLFFHRLDEEIRKLETVHKMNVHSKLFYDFIAAELMSNQSLFQLWSDMFVDQSSNTEECTVTPTETIHSLFVEIYRNTCVCHLHSFLETDYLRKLKTQKEEAHRKQKECRQERKLHFERY